MDRWVLDGDSYSFIRSAPRTFNLQDHDGLNRVEIFDITAIPSHRNAISETTCLCDIFGDDCESPSLSSSPASTTFLKKEPEQTFPTDDANDSSGSYHTASGSDSGDATEVTYATPSPKTVRDISRESVSSPIESNVISDSQNGPLHCTPPASCVESDDLSHADYWEEPQVMAGTSPANEAEKLNVSESLVANSTHGTSMATSAKKTLEERVFVFHEQEVNTTPEQTNTSPPENTEVMNKHSSQSEDCTQHMSSNSRSSSKLSRTSETDNNCSPIQSTSPTNIDSHFISVTPELKVTASPSPIVKETSLTPVPTGNSSPAMLNLRSSQLENTVEFKGLNGTGCTTSVSTLPAEDNVEMDYKDVSPVARELVCSTNVRETPESSEIINICSPPDDLEPAHSPEQVIIYSPLGYTISPSPTNEGTVYSTYPEASQTSPDIDHHETSSSYDLSVLAHSPQQIYFNNPSPVNEGGLYSTYPEASPPPPETCSFCDLSASTQSSEPVTIYSHQSYSRNPSPIHVREVYSTEPEASPLPPETCSSCHLSATPQSPEPETIHSHQSYSSNPSPINEREVYSTEPEASPLPPETCSSCDLSATPQSPEPETINSHQSYSSNPSPRNEREVYSTEPEASPVPPETCSSCDLSATPQSPEPQTIHSHQSYSSNPSPINEREVYSTESETSPPCHDTCSSCDLSASAHSPEPVIIPSPLSYPNSPSPIIEREVYSTEPKASLSFNVNTDINSSKVCSTPDPCIPAHSPETIEYTISPSSTKERDAYSSGGDDLPPSPTITRTDNAVTPTYSQESTSELRRITSTPNIRKNYLTPEPSSPAPSLDLRAITNSPEIKTVSYSVLQQNANSPAITISAVSSTEVLSPKVEKPVSGTATSNSLFVEDPSVSLMSRKVLSTPGSISRPSSTNSGQIRDSVARLQPGLEPSTSPEQTENQPSPIACEAMVPFPSPMECRHHEDVSQTETFKQSTSVQNECRNASPQVLSIDSYTSPTSLVQIENVKEVASVDTTNLKTQSAENKPLEIFDNRLIEMLQNDGASCDVKFSQVPLTLSKSPRSIRRNNEKKYENELSGERVESEKREGEGVETVGEGSCRGEQVELSFSSKNRKGPAGHSPAPSSRDPKSEIPPRCYFESHPTALRQQSLLRAQRSQQDNKGGTRRLQSSVQGKFSNAGFLPPECLGETSSMASEFDEADDEVKWFSDLAFTSLSSPQVDYLDMYNSSHRSSTNVSQPSTNVDSPGAVAWMNYADLRGSALHEHDSSSFASCDGLITARRFEMGSFECVDVALETKEESSRRKRTVPKRQIQLLRRNTDESKPASNHENVSPNPSKDTFVRQYSTPVFVQKGMAREEPSSPQTDRKRPIQKSLSLDDDSPKTQMASCIIKSVLSKKMQDAQKEPLGDLSPTGDKYRHLNISPSSFEAVQSSSEKQSLYSSLQSNSPFSSEDFASKEERSPHYQHKKCAPKVPPKPAFRPAFMNTGKAKLTREETRTNVHLPFEDKACVMLNGKYNKESRGGNQGEHYNKDTNAAVATQTVKMQSSMSSRDTQRHMTQENRWQQGGKSVFMSKTPEITLKPSTTVLPDKKKSSVKVSLSPDVERSREMCEYQSVKKSADDVNIDVSNTKDDHDNTKSFIHKVRDVRKLVKNTFNLSFKASDSTSTREDAPVQEKPVRLQQAPPALQIECKAISWKDKHTDSKAIHWQGGTQAVDISKIPQPQLSTETSRDTDITEIKSKASLPMMPSKDSQSTTFSGLNEPDKITERPFGYCAKGEMQEMPPRPPSKDKEVSALIVLQNDTSKTVQNAFDSAINDPSQIKAASSSHSVSMLLKEKGMQADIGVCDVITDCESATAKHVNRLEIPLQSCLTDTQASSTSSNTSLLNNSSTMTHGQDCPREQSENAKVMLAKESSLQQRKEQTNTEILSDSSMTQISNLTSTCKPVVGSISSHLKNNIMPVTGSKEIELPIQVRSISNDRLKPFVPPKASYKPSLTENDTSKSDTQTTCVLKQQAKSTNEPKKNDHETMVPSNNTKRLSVSAVSSYKPPPIPTTTTPSTLQKYTTTFGNVHQQQSPGFLQGTNTSQIKATSFIQDHSVLSRSFASNTSNKPTASASQTYSHTQPVTRSTSNNRFNTEDYRFYGSDDPPSYDERESFSPVRVSDLPPQRLCRYHAGSKQSACSCTQTSQIHQGPLQHGPKVNTPPASPGQVLPCPGGPPQAQVRPHQCRPDGQTLNYLPVSSNPTAPHASALIQPLHHKRAGPVPNYGDEQPPGSGPHVDRRPNRSPHAVSPYHEYAHSANMPQLFNPQELQPSFGHEYGNDSSGGASVLYPENASGMSCGQAPRRVLLDPDTGKYFYVEVPMQPLRKMLFDPELGQYVEVLIPQQAMSHSGLYPPAAPPYSSLHNSGLYAPQYLPYAVPSYQAIPSSAQQVRHSEAQPVPTTLHQTSLRYGSPATQMPKNDPKGHPSLDQSYLESMYYIPTGINASPNSHPSDCYHKPTSNMPPGGRRV